MKDKLDLIIGDKLKSSPKLNHMYLPPDFSRDTDARIKAGGLSGRFRDFLNQEIEISLSPAAICVFLLVILWGVLSYDLISLSPEEIARAQIHFMKGGF